MNADKRRYLLTHAGAAGTHQHGCVSTGRPGPLGQRACGRHVEGRCRAALGAGGAAGILLPAVAAWAAACSSTQQCGRPRLAARRTHAGDAGCLPAARSLLRAHNTMGASPLCRRPPSCCCCCRARRPGTTHLCLTPAWRSALLKHTSERPAAAAVAAHCCGRLLQAGH